ncbi:hypothetical protein [Asanoa siamensis]|uniref:Uncharacterized protein n=1 Tax=Asanoa siamensis TaxID=926357 RepID=A0ABQ4CKU8_9ACTN|nr:hypothetical protein [Asanoa siamensis]GIF71910.1 hypothetical protein Asi02nite_14280 [Asanoa siamensis]
METNPDLEFDHFLAEKLGKFVHEIREMPAADYYESAIYYARKAQRAQLEQLKGGGSGK